MPKNKPLSEGIAVCSWKIYNAKLPSVCRVLACKPKRSIRVHYDIRLPNNGLFCKCVKRKQNRSNYCNIVDMKKKTVWIIALAILIIITGYLIDRSIRSSSKNLKPVSDGFISFSLDKHDPSARSGDISISEDDTGMLISGAIDGSKPIWPENASSDMSTHDHIDLWISDGTDARFPPIGWGNQFGNPTLDSANDCDLNAKDGLDNPLSDPAKCKIWFADQVKFRDQFKKLFYRQWHIAPNISREDYASPAFDSLPGYVQEELAMLKPNGSPTISITDDPTGKHAYTFTIKIPWNILPPIQSLNMNKLNMLVDIFSPSTDNGQSEHYSSISDSAATNDSRAFKMVALPKPKQYSITSCKYKLSDNGDFSAPSFSDRAVPYIFPSDNQNIDTDFMVDNMIHGYQYNPDASSTSPTAYSLGYFEKEIGAGDSICGPKLAYRNGSNIIYSDTIATSSSIEAKRISDDGVLVKSGPFSFSSYYGSGQCGACTRGKFTIVYFDLKNSTTTTAFSFETVFDSNDVDFDIAKDWMKITEYDYDQPIGDKEPFDYKNYVWSSTDYCFNGKTHTYDQCGHMDKASPPSPRNFSPELNGV